MCNQWRELHAVFDSAKSMLRCMSVAQQCQDRGLHNGRLAVWQRTWNVTLLDMCLWHGPLRCDVVDHVGKPNNPLGAAQSDSVAQVNERIFVKFAGAMSFSY